MNIINIPGFYKFRTVYWKYQVGWVYRRTRVTQWAIADGLEFIQKDDPETCHGNFDFHEGLAPALWYPQRYNLDGNLEDIAPTMNFTCTRYHQGGILPGEPRSRAVWSGAECSSNLATAGGNIRFMKICCFK